MAPNFDRRLHSIAAEPPVNFQGHMTTFTIDLMTLRLDEFGKASSHSLSEKSLGLGGPAEPWLAGHGRPLSPYLGQRDTGKHNNNALASVPASQSGRMWAECSHSCQCKMWISKWPVMASTIKFYGNVFVPGEFGTHPRSVARGHCLIAHVACRAASLVQRCQPSHKTGRVPYFALKICVPGELQQVPYFHWPKICIYHRRLWLYSPPLGPISIYSMYKDAVLQVWATPC